MSSTPPISPRSMDAILGTILPDDLPADFALLPPQASHGADSIEVGNDATPNFFTRLFSEGCITGVLALLLFIVVVPPLLIGYLVLTVYEEIARQIEIWRDWLFPEEKIPEEFHNDPVFERTCLITQEPLRFPVYDGRHPEFRDHPDHIFGKTAILRWLRTNPTHPTTREPMTPEDLVPHVELQNQIEARLAVLRANPEQNASR